MSLAVKCRDMVYRVSLDILYTFGRQAVDLRSEFTDRSGWRKDLGSR